ncbi:hypothetical protein TWF481_012154 [Arthrobotrys musiformis]|uniref:Peptidase S8/S53 domain-containing protein n=1 Tax=Arthrobotrys musiformis TaxID=47236 RepID=A0AAV9VXR0_9PEZI
MKTLTFLSTTLIITILQSTVLTAPTLPSSSLSSTKQNHKRQWHHPGSIRPITAHSTDSTDDDPYHDYIAILSDDETRPWGEIFDEMGFSTKGIKKMTHSLGVNLSGKPSYNMTSYDMNSIKTFGKNLRAFTINMRESDAEGMDGNPSLASLEKMKMREWAFVPGSVKVLPSSPTVRRRRGVAGLRLTKRQDDMTWIQQGNAPWNLQRLSSEHKIDAKGRQPTDLTYNYRFDEAAGKGVDVYVVDSGINVDHLELQGRARMMFSYFGKVNDDVGHGTHCAGTIAALHYGVAKNVNIWGIKVGDSTSGINGEAIVAGIDAAISRHNQRKNQTDFMGSVISMSIGTAPPQQSDFMILKKAVEAGMHVSVAAMNSATDACNFSPGAFSQQIPIINVGAADIDDTRAPFSNFGKCVDIYAPGVSIVSTFNNNATGIASLDGTSMACPAVTGIIADELVKNPKLRLDPAAMKKHILGKALKGVIKADNVISSSELMAYNGFPGDPA